MTGRTAQGAMLVSGRCGGFSKRSGCVLVIGALAVCVARGTASAGVNEWTSGGPGGGDIATIVVDPGSPAIIYAGTLTGVFKSSDAGTTWRITGLTGTAVATLAIDPLHATTLYAGTRTGVWKSTDAGDHWSATALRDVAVDLLVIDPSNSRIVFAGGFDSTLYGSTDAGGTWQPSRTGMPDPFYLYALAMDPHRPSTIYAGGGDNDFPLQRSTDGGRTWQGVELPAGHCCIVFAIAFDPQTPDTIYLSAGIGVLKSDDGGVSWQEISGTAARLRFAAFVVDPVASTTLYALVEAEPSGDGAVYKSTDAGRTWQRTGLGQLDFRELRALAIDGTGGALYASTKRALVTSSDGGATWSPTALPGASFGGIAIDPSRPERLYAATAIGVFRSGDRGATWLQTGLRDPAQQVLVDPATPGTIYALSLSRIVKTVDDGVTWSPADDEQIHKYGILALVIDPTSSQVLYAAAGTGVFKSTDGAQHWTRMNDGITYTPDSLAIAASDPLSLYGGTYREGVFATHDGAVTWTQVLGYGRVDAVLVDPTAGTVYAAYDQGVRSRDGGRTWEPAVFPSAVDPTDPNTLYAGLSKSTDGGATFSPLPPLPLDPIYSQITAMVIHPAEPTRLYAATYAGVFSLEQNPDIPTPTATPVATPTASISSSDHGGGCALDPQPPRGALPLALFCIAMALRGVGAVYRLGAWSTLNSDRACLKRQPRARLPRPRDPRAPRSRAASRPCRSRPAISATPSRR